MPLSLSREIILQILWQRPDKLAGLVASQVGEASETRRRSDGG